LAWDIQATKDLGFNTIRKHIKVEPARWYYHADQIGMMVWQDMPSGSNNNDAQRTEFRTELEGMIDQLQPYNSIIGWIPFNEGWGEWDRTTTGQIADWVGDHDPSRIVNAHSGVNCCNSKGDSGRGDVIDWHQYTGPAAPAADASRAAIDGEHGGFSLSIPGRVWPGGSVNPYGEVTDSTALTDAYVANTAALVGDAQADLSGSIYTQLTDVEGEVNGFYTYDRQVPKMDEGRVRAINQKVIEVGSRPRAFPPSTAGPDGIAHWNFDENSGTTSVDLTSNDHTLTLHGASWTPGVSGSALKFDGKTDYATALLPDLDTTGSYSISAWTRLDALPAGGTYETFASLDGVTGKSPIFLQYGDPISGYGFSFADERAVARQTPALGSWHHVVGVRDAEAGTLTLYVDGAQAGSYSSRMGMVSDGTFNLGRGQWEFKDADYLNGAIDEVRVFDTALTTDQARALSARPVTPAAVTFTDEPGTERDTYTVPESEGVVYLVDGTVVSVGTHPGRGPVTVAARVLDGYALAEGATSEWSHVFSTDPVTPELPVSVTPPAPTMPSSPPTSESAGSGLSNTGAPIAAWALLALGLGAAGGLLVRRRTRRE